MRNVAQHSGRPTLVSLDPLSLQTLEYMGAAYSALGLGSSISRAVLVRRLIHAAPVHLSGLVEASRQGDRSVLTKEKQALAKAALGVQHARRRYWVDVNPFPTWAESDPRHNPRTLDTLFATADRLFG